MRGKSALAVHWHHLLFSHIPLFLCQHQPCSPQPSPTPGITRVVFDPVLDPSPGPFRCRNTCTGNITFTTQPGREFQREKKHEYECTRFENLLLPNKSIETCAKHLSFQANPVISREKPKIQSSLNTTAPPAPCLTLSNPASTCHKLPCATLVPSLCPVLLCPRFSSHCSPDHLCHGGNPIYMHTSHTQTHKFINVAVAVRTYSVATFMMWGLKHRS